MDAKFLGSCNRNHNLQMENTTTEAFTKVQLARNQNRPYTQDIIGKIFTDFVEISGDRRYADDPAIISGFAKLDNIEVCVIGHQKGRDLNQRRFRNFGMPKPEGYRKAMRVMRFAEKFSRPVITFVDTPGAYPGIDAEERGQAEAIAFNLREMASLKVPIIVVVIGEGGSGGALAIGVGDVVLMMENAVYSVITPEGCAAILWKDAGKASQAAECLKLTAENLISFGIIDKIIPEIGVWEDEIFGENDSTFKAIKDSIRENLRKLNKQSVQKLLQNRLSRFRGLGIWQ